MKRTVVDCDRCGKKNVAEPHTITLDVDDRPDGAGGPSETIIERLDLCPKCLADCLQDFLKRLGINESRKWIRRNCPEFKPTYF